MNDDEIESLHTMALGEALYASALAQSAFFLATSALPGTQTKAILDDMLLVMETQNGSAGSALAPVQYARKRLEGLLAIYSK